MRFLVDRCAGRKLAQWLKGQGHDVTETRELGADPGDRALLEWSVRENRVLVTLDKVFGEIVFVEALSHAGLVRLPDVGADEWIRLMQSVLDRHAEDLESGAIITVRGNRIRTTWSGSSNGGGS